MNVIPIPSLQVDSVTEEVTKRIEALLWQCGGPCFAKVDTQFKHGTATLSGTVRSFHERQLCIACCQHVPGVHHVIDHLIVDYPKPIVLSSAESASD